MKASNDILIPVPHLIFYDYALMSGHSKGIALVTGSAARIGRAIALSLAQSGWTVAVHFGNAATAAGETVEEIKTGGGKAKAFQANLTDEKEGARITEVC